MIREAISVLLLSVVYCDVAYRYSETLDPERRFVMEWDVDYAKEIVNFKLTVALTSKEWFAFGFSDHGELTNADLLVVWTDPKETRFFKDARTDQAALIHIDEHQDFRLIDSCSRDDKHTLKFSRKFNTCHGDYIFDRGTTHVLYLIGQGRPDTVENIDVRSLSSGVHFLQLLREDTPHVPSDAFNIDTVVPSMVIPNTTDTYWWVITKLPPMPKKLYIIGFGPLNEHPEVIHHLALIHCPVLHNQTMPYYSGRRSDYQRSTSHHIANADICYDPLVPFGQGGGTMIFPNETGMPIGGPDYSPFVILEIHYHNPNHLTGLVDQSGVRLIVTPTPRRYEASSLDLTSQNGHDMAIPPGQTNFPLTTMCSAQCTRAGIRPQGIWIFGYKVHNHQTGRRAYVQHIRNGTQLPDIFRDDHYTPLFQDFRLLPAPVHVLPGDELVFYLIGSTTKRTRVAVTGLYFANIMYTADLYFYPKTELQSCRSMISEKALDRFFATMRLLGGDPTSAANGKAANYASIRWTPLKVYILHLFYTYSPVAQKCLSGSNKELLPNQRPLPQPQIRNPLKIIDSCKVTPE